MTTDLQTIDLQARVTDLWLSTRSSVNTQTEYRREVDRFTTWAGKPLAEVTTEDLLEYRGYLEGLGLSARSRNRALAAVKSLITFAHESFPEYLPVNVGRAVPREPYRTGLHRRILEDVTRLFAAEPDPAKRAVLEALYYTGCRVTELCQLRWEDTFRVGEHYRAEVLGKGGKVRLVDIPRRVYEALRLTKTGQLTAGSSNGLVLGGMDRRVVYRIVSAAGRRIGVKLSPHRLRHTCLTDMAKAGAPAYLIQRYGGHGSFTTTQYYIDTASTESALRYLEGDHAQV